MRERRITNERPVVRRAMTVGAADDRYEREADRVAKRVVTEITGASSTRAEPLGRQSVEDEELAMKRATPVVSRQSIEDEELAMKRTSGIVRRAVVGAEGGDLDPSVVADIDAARSGGRPLEPGLRRSVEPAFGADFSGVRMHTGARADRLNADLGARAFTTGADVFVRSSDYRPDTTAGKELIAHELTHVVQQGGAPALDDRA